MFKIYENVELEKLYTLISVVQYQHCPKHLSRLMSHDIILNNYNLITNQGGMIFLFINSAKTNIIVFSCNSNFEILHQMNKLRLCLLIVPTFKNCPKLFSIHYVKNIYYVPLVIFLLSNKTSDTFTKAFRLIQDIYYILYYPDKIMGTLKEPFMQRSLKYGS